MNSQYRLEVFDQLTFAGKCAVTIEDPEIAMDILTLQKSTFTCKSVDAVMGDWVRVLNATGDICYEGQITSLTTENEKTQVSCLPLLSLLDVQGRDRFVGTTHSFASVIALEFNILYGMLNLGVVEYYITGTNTLATVTGTIPEYSTLYDLLSYAMTNYGIYCDISLDLSQKKVHLNFVQRSTPFIIDCDTKNILDTSFKFGDATKINTYWGMIDQGGDSSYGFPYALYKDGQVKLINDYGSTDRVLPAVWKIVTYPDEGLEGLEEQNAFLLAEAKAAISGKKYLNEVQLTLKNNATTMPSGWLSSTYFHLGTACTLKHDGTQYSSMLTGYLKKGDKTTLIFGTVRTELTKQLASSTAAGSSSYSNTIVTNNVITDATSGTFSLAEERRNGNVVTIYVAYKNPNSTAAGKNFCTATFTGTKPPHDVEAFAYYIRRMIGLRITPDGEVTVRNVSGESADMPNDAYFSLTYLI